MKQKTQGWAEGRGPRRPLRGAEQEQGRQGEGAGGAGASAAPLASPKPRGAPASWELENAGGWMLPRHSTAWGSGLGAGQGLRVVPVGSGAAGRVRKDIGACSQLRGGLAGRRGGEGRGSPQLRELGGARRGHRGQKQGAGGGSPAFFFSYLVEPHACCQPTLPCL